MPVECQEPLGRRKICFVLPKPGESCHRQFPGTFYLGPLPSHLITHPIWRYPRKRTNTDDAGAFSSSKSSSGACHRSEQALVDPLHRLPTMTWTSFGMAITSRARSDHIAILTSCPRLSSEAFRNTVSRNVRRPRVDLMLCVPSRRVLASKFLNLFVGVDIRVG